MRKLSTSDIFAALRIVKNAELREELKPFMLAASKGEVNVEDLGLDVILTVMEAVSGTKAEHAFYQFLAGPFEMSAEDVAALPLDDLAENLSKLAEENDLHGFFVSVSGLMRKKSST